MEHAARATTPPSAPADARPPDMSLVASHLRADAAADRFSSWGLSTVVDEHVGRPVVPRSLFEELHALAGVKARFPLGNAGVLHVYGYWFSTVVTSYGYKRDRWQDGELAQALGCAPDAFHLDAETGTTPLQRVTAAVSPLLRHPSTASGGWADADVGGLHTRTVLHRAPGAAQTALCYGLDSGDGMRLITTFPVAGDTHALLLEVAGAPRLRWNAVVPRT